MNIPNLSPVVFIAFGLGILLSLLMVVVWVLIDSKRQKLKLDSDNHLRLLNEKDLHEQLRLQYEKKLTGQQIEYAQLSARFNELRLNVKKKDILIEKHQQLKSAYIKLEVKYEEQSERLRVERTLLDDTKKELYKEFQLSANKIFDEKQQSFQRTSQSNMELILEPFKQQLNEFHKKVDSVYTEENTQRNQLYGQILELQKHTQKVSSDASNLANALKGNNKIQGDWGELILERLLEQSGLTKGREYKVQTSLSSEDGRQLRPDVLIYLPEGKHIIIDAKVSLTQYERFSSEEDKQKRKGHLTKHIESLKKHVKSLSAKHYEQITALKTLDFVFVFIPIEAAYLHALEFSPNLFQEAYEMRVIVVSPSSLMVALRTIETIWRYEKQNKNAETIAASAGKLYDQFALVTDSLDQLGSYLNKAENSYDQLYKRFTSGKGNLLRRVDRLRELGAITNKRLSENFEKELNANKDLS